MDEVNSVRASSSRCYQGEPFSRQAPGAVRALNSEPAFRQTLEPLLDDVRVFGGNTGGCADGGACRRRVALPPKREDGQQQAYVRDPGGHCRCAAVREDIFSRCLNLPVARDPWRGASCLVLKRE